jgi:hypothetical protein
MIRFLSFLSLFHLLAILFLCSIFSRSIFVASAFYSSLSFFISLSFLLSSISLSLYLFIYLSIHLSLSLSLSLWLCSCSHSSSFSFKVSIGITVEIVVKNFRCLLIVSELRFEWTQVGSRDIKVATAYSWNRRLLKLREPRWLIQFRQLLIAFGVQGGTRLVIDADDISLCCGLFCGCSGVISIQCTPKQPWQSMTMIECSLPSDM